ncbi:phage virion morphogenesis protein [Vibrio coralliilyticus]|uniref:phage virion morphogenesis protein n=1 Tax=Vibrio coralliilyticus TaxID=190893 RepID=UPI00148C027B|nr:phage virion morphogenesis protein [Vibrio coralliilyticus]NOI31886.1 virion morphogenesis protein [Vibrio coralliilyticus]NOI51232.1 virion morphogenesis protein [Vibrio coralliilyticus]
MGSNARNNFDFSAIKLDTPEQLTQVVESLVLQATERFDLNRRMANRTRQYFRQKIREQRDIYGNQYQSRRKRITTKVYKDIDGTQYDLARNTANNKNMLLGLSRSLRTYVTDDSFAVGLTGVAAAIGREHNEGSSISFTTRVNGFYNSKTGRWEGGVMTKRNYKMPQRIFIGWTPELEKELLAMAVEALLGKSGD